MKTIITASLPSDLETHLSASDYDRLFVLTDANSSAYCLPLISQVPQIVASTRFTIASGDANKSLEQLADVWKFLSDNQATRRSILLNLGGGMITDLGGFAGATFKRGIRTINVPTTVMAAVDAAVGGKTGINFNGLKNEIGSFYPPEAVFIDSRFFATLDSDNFLSGYAEMIKHSLLDAPATLASILSFDPIASIDIDSLNAMIASSVAIKERIVTIDPLEKGIRKALNLGHTVGHALESLSFADRRPMLHGRAVALGLVCELYISHKLCRFPVDVFHSVAGYIKERYSPYPLTCASYDALYELMTHDKKNPDSHSINFTLLAGIGEILTDQLASRPIIDETMDFYSDFFGI
ncbi:MAG: 3-dehydroquinate synthase [Tannerellaceae bacterium]|jgi:3-dehydroquinate synthase|nr:3-dehydroquinate synthase [Tannerellaceae bacterium]